METDIIIGVQELVAADDALPSLASEMAAIHFEQIIELTRQIDILTEKIKTPVWNLNHNRTQMGIPFSILRKTEPL